MMLEDRLTLIEKRMRSYRRITLALSSLLVILVGAAAQGPLVDLVCRSIEVKSEEGKTVTFIKQTGDIVVGGRLKVGDTDVFSTIDALQKNSKNHEDRIAKLETSVANLTTVVNSLNAELKTRPKVAITTVPFGVIQGKGPHTRDISVPADTLAVVAIVTESDGANRPMPGDAKVLTHETIFSPGQPYGCKVVFSSTYDKIGYVATVIRFYQ